MGGLRGSVVGSRGQGDVSCLRNDVLPLGGRDGQVKGGGNTIDAGEEDVCRAALLVGEVIRSLWQEEAGALLFRLEPRPVRPSEEGIAHSCVSQSFLPPGHTSASMQGESVEDAVTLYII